MGPSSQNSKKTTDIWTTFLGSRQCQKCLDGGSWVSLALLTCFTSNNVFYFGSITQIDVMPKECAELSRKWRNVLGSRKCHRCVDGGSWVSLKLLTWLRNDKLSYFGSFTEFDVMSEERLELSKRMIDIWKSFLASTKWQRCVDRGSWVSMVQLKWIRNYK